MIHHFFKMQFYGLRLEQFSVLFSFHNLNVTVSRLTGYQTYFIYLLSILCIYVAQKNCNDCVGQQIILF